MELQADLNIAMKNVATVQIVESLKDLWDVDNADGFRQAAKLIEQLRYRALFDILHHNVELVLLLSAFDESNDICPREILFERAILVLGCWRPFKRSASAYGRAQLHHESSRTRI